MADSINQTRFLNPWKLHMQKLGLELKCPLCLIVFKEPVLLPCNHIFCKSCIPITTQFQSDCLVCTAPYSSQDVRPAPYIENTITIYRSMEATLNASLNHSKPDRQVPISSSRPGIGGNNEGNIPNKNQVSQSSAGSPPSVSRSRGVDDTSDRGSQHSPKKYSSKRPAEDNRTGQAKNDNTPKRQKNMNHEFMQTDGKNNALQLDTTNFSEDPKVICSFCQSYKISKATGSMLHYKNGKQVVGQDAFHPNIIHAHTTCIEWAPQVYHSGEIIKNLDREIARGAKLKCGKCGLKGAALGCYENKCKKTYHAPCAVEVLGCRWDVENYLMLCPTHSSNKFPNEKSRPLKPLHNKHPTPVPADMSLEQSRFWETSPHGPQEWVLCGSGLSAEEKLLLMKLAGMSKITFSKLWKPNVTHVIAATDANGACCRTFKFLMAILHGKWILTIDWIKACLNAMHPVDELHYEVRMDNHGCCDGPKTGRLRVLANEPKLLRGFHFYFCGDFLLEYKRDLQNLIKAAGGSVMTSTDKGQDHDGSPLLTLVVYNLDTSHGCQLGQEKSIVQQRFQQAEEFAEKIGSHVISHTWLLESIAACKLQPFSSL